MSELTLDYSSWFLLICAAIGVLYAYILYSKKAPWNTSINNILSVIRFVIVSFLVFLLLNPVFKQLVNEIEKPVFIIGVDNSTSILNAVDSIHLSKINSELYKISQKMEANGYDVAYRSLSKSNATLSSIEYSEKTTDLNSFFNSIQADYESRNLAGVLFTSDGNYNSGISPAYFPYGFKIHTLGIGDTTELQDVILKNVLYNKIAYQGNKFPVVAELVNQGFNGKKVSVTIKKGNAVIKNQDLTLNSKNGYHRIEFEIAATKKGINHYKVEVKLAEPESILSNNSQDIFIDIIEGKQKILILAPAPHPDIKALQSVIGNNENYELDVFIPGVNTINHTNYDLVIVHQYYDRFNLTNSQLQQFKKKNTPLLFIIGKQSNEVLANNQDPNFNFKQIRNQYDQVGPSFNPDFTKFTFDINHNDIMRQYPTIDVPYGEIELTADMHTILYQQIGTIVTNKPILYVKDVDGVKSGYFIGDGFWQWRLQEYAINENTKVFDDLFSKLIQYLSSKVDKRKFRVKTSKTEFYDNESVSFSTEVYNDIYERIQGDNIQLTISNDTGFNKDYSFIAALSSFGISNLVQGIYSYKALNTNKKLLSSGRFTVKNLQLELLDQSANHSLLRKISKNTGADFYSTNDIQKFSDDPSNFNASGIIHSNEDFFALVNLKWLFFVVLILITIEWFIRKYQGGY
jgi:hypothetical protein